MDKIRVSYTLLKLWQQGRIDDAIVYYFKMGKMTNKYIEEGLKWDKLVNDSVQAHRMLPDEFGGDKLTNPLSQVKWVVDYDQQFDLVGVADIVDEPILYEIKTGSSKDSADYSMDFQIGMYLVLAELSKVELDRALILHYDQNAKKLDKTLVWNSKEERDRARNYIDSIAPEIFSYFETHNLFNKEVKKGEII